MITVKNITKKYGNQIAINNISFSIKKGEVVGFLGPNGAGKSTMMKIINSHISSDLGSVSVGGLNVFKKPVESKKLIGYLPENNPLYTEMYVREYLEYVANIYKVDFSEIENAVNKTGLSKEANKKISQLSKGYKQRVGLAAAIIHNPDYLILDEPTTGLDPNQIVEIRNLIKEFGKEKTVLLSTHIMQEVEAMCDRVIIINKGALVVDEYLSDFGEKDINICKVVFDSAIDAELLTDNLDVAIISNEDNVNYSLEFKDENILQKLLEFTNNQECNILEYKISEKNLEE
jgi:ABC-2 type transport system ATP-binding protein